MKSDRTHGRDILACTPWRGEAGDVAGGSGSLSWPCIAIGTLCDRTAVEDPQSRPSFRYVDISSIDRISKEIVEAQEIDGLAAPSRARKVIRAGDVLVSTVRPNLNAVAIVPDHLDGQIASTGFAVLRPKRQRLSERYLYYYCCTPEFVAALSAKVRGAQYPAVSDEDVRNVSIPLPPPSEQRRIVEILDQADRLRRLRAAADARADRILPALFYKMFGDPAANPKGWKTRSLGELTAEFRYGTSTRCYPAAAGLPVLRIPNIVSGEVDLTDVKYAELSADEVERLRLIDGDLLFVRTNGNRDYVGRCAVFDLNAPYLFASYLIRVRLKPSEADPWYVRAFTSTPRGRQLMDPFIRTTAGQSNISVEGLSRIPVSCPPLLEQQRFRPHLFNLRGVNRQRKRAAACLEHTFATLLYRAFSGELTAKWREAHMKELLWEMEQQAKALSAPARLG